MNIDLAQATVLVAAIVGLVSIARSVVFGIARERLMAAVVLVVALLAVILTAESDWGNDQVVLGKHLDKLSVVSLILLALILAGNASTLWEVLTSVRNIGSNQVKPPVVRPITKAQQSKIDAGEKVTLPSATGTGHPIAR